MQSNFWADSKKFGPAQKILRPVKGQGKSIAITAFLYILIKIESSTSGQRINKFMISLIIFTIILNRGDCKGDQEWNCKCVSQNDVEVDADISDVEYENFDA